MEYNIRDCLLKLELVTVHVALLAVLALHANCFSLRLLIVPSLLLSLN